MSRLDEVLESWHGDNRFDSIAADELHLIARTQRRAMMVLETVGK